jgi:hypothetical protein
MSKNPAAVALGRLGGKKTSEAKAAAARANAKKPRPNARGKKKPRGVDKSNVRDHQCSPGTSATTNGGNE